MYTLFGSPFRSLMAHCTNASMNPTSSTSATALFRPPKKSFQSPRNGRVLYPFRWNRRGATALGESITNPNCSDNRNHGSFSRVRPNKPELRIFPVPKCNSISTGMVEALTDADVVVTEVVVLGGGYSINHRTNPSCCIRRRVPM